MTKINNENKQNIKIKGKPKKAVRKTLKILIGNITFKGNTTILKA